MYENLLELTVNVDYTMLSNMLTTRQVQPSLLRPSTSSRTDLAAVGSWFVL